MASTLVLLSLLALLAKSSPWQYMGIQKPVSTHHDSVSPVRMNLSFGDNDSVSALDKSTIDVFWNSMFIDIDTNPDPIRTPDDVVRGIKLLIDTGSDISWMARGNCFTPGPGAQCSVNNRYPEGKIARSTVDTREWSVTYGTINVRGETMTTYLIMGDAQPPTWRRLEIGLADRLNYVPRRGESGLFGLEPSTGNRWLRTDDTPVPPLWVQLSDWFAGPQNRKFTIAAWDDGVSFHGMIEFGGTLDAEKPGDPTTDMTANIILGPGGAVDRWEFNMVLGALVDGNQMNLNGGAAIRAAFDTGAPYIYLDPAILNVIHNAMNAQNVQGQLARVNCKYMTGRAFLMVFMHAAVANRFASLHPRYWVIPGPNGPDDCRSLLQPTGPGMPQAVFGMPWFFGFKKTVFDLSNQRITVSKK